MLVGLISVSSIWAKRPLVDHKKINIENQSQSTSQAKIELPVTKVVLDNGLKILLVPNKQSPTVACRLFFTTGSVHEHAGNSGIAHMLEHMLFKGTKKLGVKDSTVDARFMTLTDSLWSEIRVATDKGDSLKRVELKKKADSVLTEHRKIIIKDELWETYTKEGGTGLNAFTTDLMTAYFVTLPKNKVELYLWLEADRMQNAILREFYPERDVVREERRMRYDDAPEGRYFESLSATFYEGHPYRVPTIGWPSDIERLTREQAAEHYRKYYKPNNAILVLAGDFDTQKALDLIKVYFGNIPRGEDFSPITFEEPTQIGPKTLTQFKDEAKPRIDIQFHTPGFPNKDLYALDVLDGVLNGKSGRLYKRLVDKEKIAISASAGNAANKYTSSFDLSISFAQPIQIKKAEKLIWNEIKSLQETPIKPNELQKVKNQSVANLARSLEDSENLATQIAFYELYGDWKMLQEWPTRISEVTAEDVMRVAQKYLILENSTTGKLLPKSKMKDND
jgi:predicted Zn-dependent peptidase